MQTDSTILEQHVVNVRTHIHAMTEDPSNKERLYVTNEDIVKLASIGRDTVFAVTAPQGTSLIVPDPDKTAPGQPPQYRWAASELALGSIIPAAFCDLSLEEQRSPIASSSASVWVSALRSSLSRAHHRCAAAQIGEMLCDKVHAIAQGRADERLRSH